MGGWVEFVVDVDGEVVMEEIAKGRLGRAWQGNRGLARNRKPDNPSPSRLTDVRSLLGPRIILKNSQG